MIISFNKNRKKAKRTSQEASRDVYQILNDIESEMERLYQEVCDNYGKHQKDKKSQLKGTKKRKFKSRLFQEDLGREIAEMELLARTIDQLGMSLTEEKQIYLKN